MKSKRNRNIKIIKRDDKVDRRINRERKRRKAYKTIQLGRREQTEYMKTKRDKIQKDLKTQIRR